MNIAYFGQTVTPMHVRMNGHRSKFVNDKNKYELSALSKHAFESHRNDFNMSIFKLGIVKRVGHNNLNREEELYITKFRSSEQILLALIGCMLLELGSLVGSDLSVFAVYFGHRFCYWVRLCKTSNKEIDVSYSILW